MGNGIKSLCLFVSILLTGCTTVRYIKPHLPDYIIEEIKKPVIQTQTDDTEALVRYALKKEAQLNEFLKFYDELKEIYK